MKSKFYFIGLLFVLLSFNNNTAQVQNLVRSGMEKAYNFEFAGAEKIFNQIIKKYPNSPEGYYRLGLIHFWTFLGSRDENEYQTFMKFANLAEEKADKIMANNFKDFATIYLAGNISTFKAMAFATNNSTLDAIWSSKKAVGYFEETLKLNKKYYDSYLGLGLFDYAMSFVPDFLKWAVNLSGLNSDKDRGFRYIKKAYQKGTSSKTEAAFHLSKIYTDYLSEYDSAFVLLRELTLRYPKNALFAYQYASSLIKDKQLDKALNYLDKVNKLGNEKMPQTFALAYYRKGEIYFAKNQYKSAIRNYERFLDDSKEIDLVGIASLNTAICYKMIGNDAQYKKYLALAKNGNQDLFEDSYAMQKSNQYLSNGITQNELKLIRYKNYINVGKYKLASDSLTIDLPSLAKDDNANIAKVYLAECFVSLKKYNEAIALCNQVLEANKNHEKWVVPAAYLYKAIAKRALGDKAAAKSILVNAADENEYDFKDQIQSKIEWLKRRL